jgi:ATP-dependent DNA helicase RecQ
MTFTFCARKFAHPFELIGPDSMNSEQPFPWSPLLHQFWGYDSLRDHQVGPVEAICAGHDAIAVLPTGGGKSLCYQLSGLFRGGTTLVVSPLIALMQDQVKDLKSKGIHAFSLAGVSSNQALERELDNAERCKPSFLFTSPEKLEGPLVRARLNRLDIRTVAIDEAHCISEWGHDFRPAYRQLAGLRGILPSATWCCFTATATGRVIQDIRANLQLKHAATFRASPLRRNLTYAVCTVRDAEAMLYHAVVNSKGTGLVYAGTRYQAEKWALRLQEIEGGVEAYHAGLDAQLRTHRLRGWISGEIRVIVCTNAFGMGIDKPDVRWVFHADIPANLESYVQEAGRAGRDGLVSECVLFLQPGMLERRRRQLEQSNPLSLPLNELYQFMANQGQVAIGSRPETPTPVDLSAFEKKYGLSMRAIERSLNLLQQAGYFGTVRNAGERTVQFSFQPDSQAELQEIAMTATEEGRVAQLLAPLALHSTDRRTENDFAGTGLAWHRIIFALQRLEEWGVLTMKGEQQLQHVEWKEPRISGSVTVPSSIGVEPYERSLERLEVFEAFLETTSCRQQFIASYFGFENEKPCGQCDNCMVDAHGESSHEVLNQIPSEGIDFKDFIRTIPANRYNIWIERLKSAEENGYIRFEKQHIRRAD